MLFKNWFKLSLNLLINMKLYIIDFSSTSNYSKDQFYDIIF